MIQAVHELLQQAPILSPAADFTQRTMALLPNTRYRMYTMGAIYGLLLLVGFVPLAVVVWFGVQFIPALGQPVLVQGMLQAGGQVLSLIQAVIGAFWQGLGTKCVPALGRRGGGAHHGQVSDAERPLHPTPGGGL